MQGLALCKESGPLHRAALCGDLCATTVASETRGYPKTHIPFLLWCLHRRSLQIHFSLFATHVMQETTWYVGTGIVCELWDKKKWYASFVFGYAFVGASELGIQCGKWHLMKGGPLGSGGFIMRPSNERRDRV